jgi:hypothetical protein
MNGLVTLSQTVLVQKRLKRSWLLSFGHSIGQFRLGEQVLQYREYVDTTVYAQDPGGYVFPPQSKMEWSYWKDVPIVEDK